MTDQKKQKDASNEERSISDSESIFRDSVVWNSEELLKGHREIFIKHGSETYRLLVTKAGKLILQK